MKLIKINRVRDFTKDEDFDGFGVVRLHPSLMSQARKDGGLRRNTWMVIKSPMGRIYRQARGKGGKGFNQDCLELDYDSRLDLGVKGAMIAGVFIEAELEVWSANVFQRCFFALWSHPKDEFRIPYRWGVFTFVLATGISLVSLAISLKG